MSKRRFTDYGTSRASTSKDHRYNNDDRRRSYSGRVSGSERPESETRREYDDDYRRYYDNGSGDKTDRKQPMKLSRLSGDGGFTQSESPSMKFQWNNLLNRKPDGGLEPISNPGSNRPNLGLRDENENACRVNAENGYGGGGVSAPGLDPTRKYGYFHGAFTSPPPLRHFHAAGVPKPEDFSGGDHRTYMGQGDKTAFGPGPGISSGLTDGFRGVSNEFNRRSTGGGVNGVGVGGGGVYIPETLLKDGFGGLSDEFNRSREMAAGPVSGGVVPETLIKEGFGGFPEEFNRSREMATGPIGGGIGPETLMKVGFGGFFDEFNRSRAMAGGPVGDGFGGGGVRPDTLLKEGFGGFSDEFNRSRAMAVGPVGSGFGGGRVGPETLLKEGFGGFPEKFNRSREMAAGPVGGGLGPETLIKEGFTGFPGEFNRNKEMAAGPTYRAGPIGGVGAYAQQCPNGEYNYNVPGVKSSDNNGDMSSLTTVDHINKKMATSGSVGEDTRPPAYLRPGIADRIDVNVNGSGLHRAAGCASSQEISQWDYHNTFIEQSQPTIVPTYQSLSELSQTIPVYGDDDEFLGSSLRTRGFGFGGDDGLERGIETLSYESALRRIALLEGGGGGDQGLDDITTLKMCAMRKRALAKRLRGGNDSTSQLLSHGLRYSDENQYEEDIEQYVVIGGDQLDINQARTFGEDEWKLDQDVSFVEDPLNINQNVMFGKDHGNFVPRDVAHEDDQWKKIDQDAVTYGVDQWDAEDINKLNYDNLLPSSKLTGQEQHCGEQCKSARVGVKKRLGPLKSPGSIKKRLGPLKSPGDVKKPLGPVKSRLRPAENDPDHKFLGCKLRDQLKPRIRETDDLSGSIHPQGGELPNIKGKPAKKEPPEDSEEFKKLVDSAFIKHIKCLNENPALRRKFMGRGGTFTTKCCVCASNSKEFAGTVPLATHAFMSHMVGLRAEHLGFHKALCVLLGWDSSAVSKDTWVQRLLPDAEALALREDVVIWPPVVVIHNSSIASKNPDERVIVTIEQLQAILQGIGFGGGKTKVRRGEAADQSILVVTFHGTFTGLQLAEKLHKLFAENKHGRAEFQQISSAGLCNSNKGEANWLYGYLGIAGDLDLLDSATKKRSMVKSKKEIEAIANTSL